MLIKDMQLGRTVEILIERDDYHFHFVSKVEGVAGYSVAVTAIVSTTEKRLFQFDEKDNISLIYKNQDRMWKFDHVKGGIAKLDGAPVHTFTCYSDGASYNRRNSFRVPIGEQLLMRRIIKTKNEQGQEIDQEAIFDGLLYDLSASGAGIYTDQHLELESEIIFDMPTNVGLLSCRGLIIREAPVNGRPFRHYYGCSFSQVKTGLERYLFEKQRMMLQKERGG